LAMVNNPYRRWITPYTVVITIVGCSIIADLVEHHSMGFFGDREQVYEEFAELVVYIAVFLFVANLGFNKEKFSRCRLHGLLSMAADRAYP
jgi:amino acid permease